MLQQEVQKEEDLLGGGERFRTACPRADVSISRHRLPGSNFLKCSAQVGHYPLLSNLPSCVAVLKGASTVLVCTIGCKVIIQYFLQG